MATLPVPRLTRSSRPAVDYQGFFRTVEEAMGLAIQAKHFPGDNPPKLVWDFPREKQGLPGTEFDLITFRVVGAEIAASTNDGRKPNGPVVREQVPDPRATGHFMTTSAWRESGIVEFTIWGKSNERAEELCGWFHRFMMEFAFVHKFFLARGVSLFRFHNRGEDGVEQKGGQELYTRTLRYEIRLEFLYSVDGKTLETVSLYLIDANSGEVTSQTLEAEQ